MEDTNPLEKTVAPKTNFVDRIKQFINHVNTVNYRPGTIMWENFRSYGLKFGATDMDTFETVARQFYFDHVQDNDARCSRTYLSDGRIGIDFDGKTRGVYDKYGNPIAFYSPNYEASGFNSPEEERQAWLSANVYD